MLEGYSKIELQIEGENYKKSIIDAILNYDNKFGLCITLPTGIDISSNKYFELDRRKLIGFLTKDDIKELNGYVYIRKEYKHCVLPDVVKIHAACYKIIKIVEGVKVGCCMDLYGLHLDYDNELYLRCEHCGKFLKRNETHTYEPNNIQHMDIHGNKRCWSNITGYTDDINLALQDQEECEISFSKVVNKYRLDIVSQEDLIKHMKQTLNLIMDGNFSRKSPTTKGGGMRRTYPGQLEHVKIEVADEFEHCPHFSCSINTNTFATHVNTLIKCPECHKDIVVEPKWICDPECESDGKYIFWLYTKEDADNDKLEYEEVVC